MGKEKIVVVYGDGEHDDTEALKAIANGEARGILPDGRPFENARGAKVLITKPMIIKEEKKMISKLRYWFKRIRGIKVYNEVELHKAIEKVRGTKRAICIMDSIMITQSIELPPNIIFLFRPIGVAENENIVLTERSNHQGIWVEKVRGMKKMEGKDGK